MSALRKCLRRPEIYLAGLVLAAGLVVADAWRAPDQQLAARAYVGSVKLYQRWGSPRLNGYIRCRFRPTCSHYSIEVVHKHGLWRGLTMTASRISRCRRNVPLGTEDPAL